MVGRIGRGTGILSQLNGKQKSMAGVRAAAAAAVQALEDRRLLAASDFDLTFGGGDGGMNVDFVVSGTNADFARAVAIQPSDQRIVLAGTSGSGGANDD